MINITYKYTDNVTLAEVYLNEITSTAAFDFECSSRFLDIEKELFKKNSPNDENLDCILNSNGLSHPSLAFITHLSFAQSNNEGTVLICSSDRMRKLIYQYLTNSELTQLWCNTLFDFQHILYNTGKIPKNWIDVQLRAKCRKNHANSSKCLVGLKQLQGHIYGEWGIAKELEFNIDNMYNEKMLKYAATDACATYNEWLYQHKYED